MKYIPPQSIVQQLMDGQTEKQKDKQTIAMSKNINDGRGNRENNCRSKGLACTRLLDSTISN